MDFFCVHPITFRGPAASCWRIGFGSIGFDLLHLMLLVTAAFKSLLSIQTFIPYTFYLPKSVVSEHYGGLFCQLGRSCLEKPEITFSYKKAAADIQKTIMFVTFYSTIAWCPFVGDEIHKNLVPASFENLEQNFWDLAG